MGMESLTVIEVVEGSTQILPAAEALALVNSAPTQWRIEPPYGAAGHMETGLLAAYQEASGNPAATFTDMLTAMIGPVGQEGTAGTDGADGPPGSTTGVQYIGQVQTPGDLPAEGNAGDIYTVVEDRKELLTAASATGAGVEWTAGEAYVDIFGTFDGATVSLERLGADETTWEQISTVSVTEDTHGPVGILPVGQVRGAISGGGGGVSVTMTLTNVDPTIYVFEAAGLLRSGGVWTNTGTAAVSGGPTHKTSYASLDAGVTATQYVDGYLAMRAAVVHGIGNWDFSRVDNANLEPAGWTGTGATKPKVIFDAAESTAVAHVGGGRVRLATTGTETDVRMYSSYYEPVDYRKSYSMECMVRTYDSESGIVFYAGFICYNKDKESLGNIWFCASNEPVTTDGAERKFCGVISGYASSPTSTQFPTYTAYVRRAFVLQSPNALTAAVDIFYSVVREIADNTVYACRDFGMEPGGDATRNADALQAMLTHLVKNGGHGIIERAGTYDLIRQITVVGPGQGFTFSGIGHGSKLRNAATLGRQIEFQDCSNIIVRDLQMDGNRPAWPDGGHVLSILRGSNILIENIYVNNGANGTGIYATANRKSLDPAWFDKLDFGGSTNLVINNCVVANCGSNGILVSRYYYSKITNCYVVNLGKQNNVSGGPNYSPCYAIQLKEGNRYTVITGNIVKNCENGIILKGGGDDPYPYDGPPERLEVEPQQLVTNCTVSDNVVECLSTSNFAYSFQECRYVNAVGNVASVANATGNTTTGSKGCPALSLKGCARCNFEMVVLNVNPDPVTVDGTSASTSDSRNRNRVVYMRYGYYFPSSDGNPAVAADYSRLECEDNNIFISMMADVPTLPFLLGSGCRKNKIRIGQWAGKTAQPWGDASASIKNDSGYTSTHSSGNPAYYI